MSAVEDGELKWVAASGLEGVESMAIRLAGKGAAARPYTVRLHFAEPKADAKPGDRIFTVSLQGEGVLRDFDVVKAAGGPRRAVVKEFRQVAVTEHLELGFTGRAGNPLICGIEIVAE